MSKYAVVAISRVIRETAKAYNVSFGYASVNSDYEHTQWLPKSQVQILSLSNCEAVVIPGWLFYKEISSIVPKYSVRWLTSEELDTNMPNIERLIYS